MAKSKKLLSLSKRIDSLKSRVDISSQDKSFLSVTARDKKDLKKMSVILNMGLEFVSGILVGIFLGYFLDRMFDNHYIFTVVFTIVGFFIGILNLFRYVKEL